MRYFAYFLDGGMSPLETNPDGTSFDILVPNEFLSNIDFLEDSLIVWLIEKKSDVLSILSSIYVESIEEIDKGRLSGYICLIGSSLKSTHYRKLGIPNDGYVLNNDLFSQRIVPSFIAIDDSLNLHFLKIVKASWKVSFLPAEKFKIDRVIGELINLGVTKDSLTIVDSVLAVKILFCESELHKSRNSPSALSPTLFYAHEIYEKYTGKSISLNEVNDVFELDELQSQLNRRIQSQFRPLEDSDFTSRKFLSTSVVAGFDWSQSLIKTERAEKKHQEILFSCASYMRQHGLTPLMNINVDLCIIKNTEIFIFEIKSSTSSNFRSQVFKAVVQLLEYGFYYINNEYLLRRRCVVIERPLDIDCEYYLLLLRSIDIDLIFYDSNLEWPHKALGLLDHLDN